MDKYSLSVIIPCFNEEEVIARTAGRIVGVLENCGLLRFELLFVNDGSTDRTESIVKSLAASDKRLRLLCFSRNFGHQAAVSAGIHACSGDLAIIMDADLQDPPELIPEMIKVYEAEKCNVLYGVRIYREGETFFKKITASLYYRALQSLSEVPLPVDTGDFRMIDREVIEAFRRFRENNKYIRGLIGWMGFRQKPFYYQREKRAAGRTKYTFRKMLKFAATGLLYFSAKPLALAINLGFLSILVGLGLIVYVFFIRFTDQPDYMVGWASTMVVIIFFGGVQLLTFGIMGRYVASIFDEVKQRPEYIIREKTNFDNP
jgi:polyisoprenyl-phosphate glycosyltransferase